MRYPFVKKIKWIHILSVKYIKVLLSWIVLVYNVFRVEPLFTSMTFDLSREQYNVLNMVHRHTNLNNYSSFLSWVTVFTKFLNFADIRWPLTSAENNTFLLFNQFHQCTKYEVHLLPYNLWVTVFTSQGISQNTNKVTRMHGITMHIFLLPSWSQTQNFDISSTSGTMASIIIKTGRQWHDPWSVYQDISKTGKGFP